MELVTSTRLAERLQVIPGTLAYWRRTGYLMPIETTSQSQHYTIESIDGILRRGATNLNSAISAIDVLQGRTNLLTLKQAAERLGTTANALQHRIERGRFPAIKLLGEWRVIEADVNHFLAQSNNYIPREIAAHIFGSSIDYIKERIQVGDLHCVTIPEKPSVRPVTLESILALLQKIAPPWVDPKAWIAERQEDIRPLLSLREFERFLGLPAHGGQTMLRDKKVAYLQRNPQGGLVGVSPVSANYLLLRQDRLTLQQIANLFGVDKRTAVAWESKALHRCQLHTHTDNRLRRACLIEMLGTCLSPGSRKISWYERRLNNPEPLLSVSEAAAFFKIPEDQVINCLQNGKLQGVTLPGSNAQWRIAKNMR